MKLLTLPLTHTKKIISKTSEKFSLVTLVTNYHKLSLLPLVVRPCRKLLLLLQVSYIFIVSTKDLNVLQISTEN